MRSSAWRATARALSPDALARVRWLSMEVFAACGVLSTELFARLRARPVPPCLGVDRGLALGLHAHQLEPSVRRPHRDPVDHPGGAGAGHGARLDDEEALPAERRPRLADARQAGQFLR